MSEQHTPGPWKVGQYLGQLSAWCVHMDAGDKGRGIDVVEAVCGISAEQRLANARLIAAAPELLHALQQLIDSGDVRDAAEKGAVSMARAAIAKAEGGAGGVQPLRAEAGWVLVPVEPTQEMLEAAVQAICYGPGGGFTRIGGPHRCWSAMLTAAPVPRPAPRNPQGTPAPQQETPVVRALQSAILSGLSHEELLEKAHHLMTLTVNQARTIGELQEAAAAEAAPQQAAPAQEGGEA